MSEFKGTKGKWEMLREPWYDESNETYSGSFDIISEGTKIVEVHAYNFWGLTFDESKANALLISKAPEMLEALKEFVRMYESVQPAGGWQGVYDEGVSLIKQATEI